MDNIEKREDSLAISPRPGFEEFFQCIKGRYSGEPSPDPPPPDTNLSSAELGKLMLPRDLQHSPFHAYQNLSMYEKFGDYVSPGRRAQELYEDNETVFQKEVQHRIINGDIDKDTLVVAITGHGPTIGYEMSKKFGSDIFAHQSFPPQNEFDATQIKLPQAQTFAKAIHDIQAKKPRVGASTLVDVDLHLFEPQFNWSPNDKLIDSDSLPQPDELLKLGVKKILLLEEKAPSCTGVSSYELRQAQGLDDRNPWLNPLFEWLNRLKNDGRIIMSEDGIDARVHLNTVRH